MLEEINEELNLLSNHIDKDMPHCIPLESTKANNKSLSVTNFLPYNIPSKITEKTFEEIGIQANSVRSKEPNLKHLPSMEKYENEIPYSDKEGIVHDNTEDNHFNAQIYSTTKVYRPLGGQRLQPYKSKYKSIKDFYKGNSYFYDEGIKPQKIQMEGR